MTFKSILAMLSASAFVVSAATANIITVTGNTAGGPAYNRLLEDLSGLSAVGTNVQYNTYKISASAAGEYTFLTTGGFDTFAFLYGPTFIPATPMTNALAGNDDLLGLTTSGVSFNLAANTDYILVTTGFGNADFGSFSSTIGGPGTISATPDVVGSPTPNNIATLTGDTTGGLTYNRPLEDLSGLSAVGTNVRYVVHPFAVDTSGSYTFLSTGEFDTFAFLYDSTFNPAAPLTNGLIANDDLLGLTTSGFAFDLVANTNYFYVMTGFGNDDFGAYSTTIAGPGAIIAPEVGVVPEPATLALLALGLAGLGFSRRKQ